MLNITDFKNGVCFFFGSTATILMANSKRTISLTSSRTVDLKPKNPLAGAEGDWNGDGRFSSGDLVVAFQDGGFEKEPKNAAAAVPESQGLHGILIIALSVAMFRRRRMNDRILYH